MKKPIRYINLLLALLISALIIYFIPRDTFPEYKAEIIYKSKYNVKESTIFHEDMNNDGVLEEVSIIFNNTAIGDFFQVKDLRTLTNRLWLAIGNNKHFIKGTPSGLKYVNDFNNNGIKEFYFFTVKGDSAYIDIIEPDSMLNDIQFSRSIHFARISHFNKLPDIWINNVIYSDINNDGYDEIIFITNAGYSIQPRAVFCYDIKNNILKRSPRSSIDYLNVNFIKDANVFLIERISSTGNTVHPDDLIKFRNARSKDSLDYYKHLTPNRIYKYGDFAAYTITLDTNLNYHFPPIEYKGHMKQSRSVFINNKIYTVVTFFGNNAFTPYLNKIDLNGNILKKQEIPELEHKNINLYNLGNDILIQDPAGNNIMIYDTTLCLKKKVQVNMKHLFVKEDLDNNGTFEFLTFNDNEINIYDSNFSCKTIVPVSYAGFSGLRFHKFSLNNEAFFDISLGDTMFTLKYFKNKLFRYKHFLYLIIFALVYSLILFIYIIQKKHIQKRYEKENEFNKLQLITIKNQLNPHFIFNALNSISSVVYQEEKDVAYHFITKFSSLIRTTLVSADRISRSLAEELTFVSDYLELEKLRFGNKFTYEIKVASDVSREMQVPKMCIQAYTENAINHAIMHKPTKGHLSVNIQKLDETEIEITIKDDGVGREYVRRKESKSTGKGFTIMRKNFELFSSLTKKRVKYKITDLYDNSGNAAGTEVNITIEI